jgi:non-specific serine/threonine protein kinase
MTPVTQYAKSGGLNVAYQVVGQGPIDLVYAPGWVSNVEWAWEEPRLARFLDRLASFSRVILFDKRGTGLSDRVQDNQLPTNEERMDDVRAVMDAVGSHRAALFGASEAANLCTLFSARHPDRTRALVTFGGFAKRLRSPDYPWAPTLEERERELEKTEREWGGPVGLSTLAPSVANDPIFAKWWASFLRHSASPKAAVTLLRMNTFVDVRDVLPEVRVPTLILHRTGDREAKVEEARYLASRIPGSRLVELPGEDHLWWTGDSEPVLDEIEEFLTGTRRVSRPVLSSGTVSETSALLGRLAYAPSVEPAPTSLLHYRIGRKLGEGGMGAVFEAEDTKLGRKVAIKRLSASSRGDKHARIRLVREARAASALNHPGIVTVFAIEEVDGVDFVVMEYVDGESLHAALTRRPLALGRVVEIGIELAEALEHAHAAGLIHRDIKPANIMITRSGGAKILDFGVAKVAGPMMNADVLTASGAVVGTGPYMSPEQMHGRDVDRRADIFALGCVIHEMATGRRLFDAVNFAALVEQITKVEPRPASAWVPSLPRELDAIVLRAIAKDPVLRFQNAAELAAALRVVPAEGAAPALEAPILQPTRPTLSSVAVLSFLDLSPARDQDYLCDGIAEEIINALTQVNGLRVAARSTSFQLKSKGLEARTIGQRLGVDAVLEGSVRRAGEKLRINVQLVETVDGYQRWSKRFDGAAADVFAIQDEIANGVAEALRGILSSRAQRALQRPETTPEAYEHFLRGRRLLNLAASESSLGLAQKSLERAIEIDPSYAPAHALLAQLHAWKGEWYGGGDESKQAAERASQEAIEVGPQLSESHVARACVLALRRQYQEAESEYREAIRINPHSFEAHYLFARVSFQQGKDEQAAELFRRGAEMQLEDFQCLILSSMPLERLGRRDEAAAALREGLRRAERMLELDPANARALSLGAVTLGKLGDRTRALEMVTRATTVAPDDAAVNVVAACLFAVSGMKDEAFAALERSFGRGYGNRDWVVHDPDYDSLRDDPRWNALFAKLK